MAENNGKLEKRSPVVVVLGHVDHGKTTLLDWIRKTKTAEKEAGGITQSIGAYEIVHNGERITFLDTPGHEAFRAMRLRGATVADIAILVVSSEEGTKPQTEESLKILKETKTPFIIAFTKIDSPRADIERIQNEMMAKEIFLEGKGGDISWQGVSGKTGEGVNELLDLILLSAEMLDLNFNPEDQARGIVVECKKDQRKGNIVTLIVKQGILKLGDNVATSCGAGKIRILEDYVGKAVSELEPSSPGLLIGFDCLPIVGEEFFVGEAVVQKEIIIENKPSAIIDEKDKLPTAVLKADVSGSLEVLKDIFNGRVKIIDASAGEITDGDIKSAISSGGFIIAFRTKMNKAAEGFAKNQKVTVFSSEIIYELIQEVENHINVLVAPEESGKLRILATFGKGGNKQTVGGEVFEGKMQNNKKVVIKRNNMELGEGKIVNLQQNKVDTAEVEAGNQCGLLIDSQIPLKIGDEISQRAAR